MNLSEHVTLVAVDGRRPDLAAAALDECRRHCQFHRSVLLSPKLPSLDDYSRFVIKDLALPSATSHCLIVQWDGYIVHPGAWRNEFLKYDYIGAPWSGTGPGMNGGFSLRSKRLLDLLASDDFKGPYHAEDAYICSWHRKELEAKGIRFAPLGLARLFACEGGENNGQFGFHSFTTKLPVGTRRPLIFHHSGTLGDIIYALPTIKAFGGGVLFITPENRTGHQPRVAATAESVKNIAPLLEHQEYVHRCCWRGSQYFGVDFDLNDFRKATDGKPNQGSIFRHHLDSFAVDHDEAEPWLTVDKPFEAPGRPIVVNRTARYQNPAFPWQLLVTRYGRWMVFIGEKKEYFQFCADFGEVAYLATANLLDAARVIAGAKVCMMNQSALCAIALGLGKNLIQETWPEDANCMLKRDNAVYCRTGTELPDGDIPKGWL